MKLKKLFWNLSGILCYKHNSLVNKQKGREWPIIPTVVDSFIIIKKIVVDRCYFLLSCHYV